MTKIKEKIMDNLVAKMLEGNIKRKYAIIFDGVKAHQVIKSQHKSKVGRKYALFCRVYFGKHKK
jgi:hypothetical protein